MTTPKKPTARNLDTHTTAIKQSRAKTAPAPKAEPVQRPYNGIYVLGTERMAPVARRRLLENPHVTGFSLRAHWLDVEPEEGQYNWAIFDDCLVALERTRSTAMLRVLPGRYSPAWLYPKLDESEIITYTDDDGNVAWMPLPWSEAYLQRWTEFVRAFAARYRDRSPVRIVAITGPAEGGEMHLGDKGNRALWEGCSLTPSKLSLAWSTMHSEFAAAWGQRMLLSQALSTATAGFGTPETVLNAVRQSAATRGVACQGNWLSAKTPATFYPYQVVKVHADAGLPTGFQTLCPVRNRERFGGTLRQAMEIGLDVGMRFVELYPTDVDDEPETVAWLDERLGP